MKNYTQSTSILTKILINIKLLLYGLTTIPEYQPNIDLIKCLLN